LGSILTPSFDEVISEASNITNHFTEYPDVIKFYLGLNFAVYLLWQLFPKFMIKNASGSIENNKAKRFWSGFFASFSHQSFAHFITNMSLFASIGPTVLGQLGPDMFHKAVLLSSCLSGHVETIVAYIKYKLDPVKNTITKSSYCLGFSGVVMSLFVLYLSLPLKVQKSPYVDDKNHTLLKFAFGFDLIGSLISFFLFPTGIGHNAHLIGSLSGLFIKNLYCNKNCRKDKKMLGIFKIKCNCKFCNENMIAAKKRNFLTK
jgi:membrane associated rhomboid family serine protease